MVAAAADPAEAVIEVAAEAAEAVPAAEVEEAVAEGADEVANAQEVAAAVDDAADARPAVSPSTTLATATTASRGLWSPVAEFSNYIPTDTAFSAIRDKTTSGCGAIRSCRAR